MPARSSATPSGAFALFLGVSMSITAFPVLARILTDRGISKIRLGLIAISRAAVDDVTAWGLLALRISSSCSFCRRSPRSSGCARRSVMGVVTTFATPPILHLLSRGRSLEDEETNTSLATSQAALDGSSLSTDHAAPRASYLAVDS